MRYDGRRYGGGWRALVITYSSSPTPGSVHHDQWSDATLLRHNSSAVPCPLSRFIIVINTAHYETKIYPRVNVTGCFTHLCLKARNSHLINQKLWFDYLYVWKFFKKIINLGNCNRTYLYNVYGLMYLLDSSCYKRLLTAYRYIQTSNIHYIVLSIEFDNIWAIEPWSGWHIYIYLI